MQDPSFLLRAVVVVAFEHGVGDERDLFSREKVL